MREFADAAFSYAGLDYRRYVKPDPDLYRPAEILGGHLKTGQSGSPQNRPVRRTQDNLFFTLPMAVVARCFLIGI